VFLFLRDIAFYFWLRLKAIVDTKLANYELKPVLLLGSKFVRRFSCLRIKIECVVYLKTGVTLHKSI